MARKSAPAAAAGTLPVPAQRALLCASVALLTYWASAGALFLHAPEAQVAVLVGIAAGLIGGVWVAAGSAALAMLLGMVTGPTSIWSPDLARVSPSGLLWVGLATAVAAGVAWLVTSRAVSPRWLLMAAVALMVANMWWTVIEIDATPVYDVRTSMNTPPLSAAIEGDLTGILRQTDGYLFAWVRQQMRKGTGYYEAYAAARPATTPGTTGPTSVLNIREPLLYWAFAAAPNAWVIIGGLLALGTLTAVSSFVLLSDVVKLPVVLPAVAAILTFTVSIASTTTLLFAESWSGMLSLLVVVAVALSQRSPRWRTFVVVAAALALLAVLIREFAFFVVLAGLASSWFGAREERRFRTLVWGGALALAVVAYATHYVAALPHVVHAVAGANQEGFGLFKGGIGFALTAFAFDSHVFAYPFRVAEAVPYLLAALGVAGAVLLPTPQTRVVALGGIIPVFLAGLVAGNAAHMVGLTQSVNYWGIMMLFVVYACIPAVFSLMPAARVRRPPTRTESR